MPSQSLNQLSDRERALLRLLAKGHTVKTAAEITGDSVHAANELLRSARRKLGVTSSREAARLLAGEESPTQENRDTKIGLEPDANPPRHVRTLVIGGIMITALLVAAGLSIAPEADQSVEAESERPVVVATSPTNGGVIPAGPFELSVTFDRPMLNQFAIFPVQKEIGEYLGCIGRKGGVKQSEDKRTFTIACEAIAGDEHAIRFGSEQGYFKDKDWRNAVPYILSFSVAPEGPKPPQSPVVIDTYPKHGAHIEPGPAEIRVTYDRPMMDQVSIVQLGADVNEETMRCGKVTQSQDLRSFSQTCLPVPGVQHTVTFGHYTVPNFGRSMGRTHNLTR